MDGEDGSPRGCAGIPRGFAAVPFLPGLSLYDYLADCRDRSPELFGCLDLERLASAAATDFFRNVHPPGNPFDSEHRGGRGDTYRSTQLAHPYVRAVGIRRLFELAVDGKDFSPEVRILDALGGNGTLCRVMRLLLGRDRCPTIFTSDISADMISDALKHGLPAVRQPAQQLVFGDSTVDAVIFAYGTHHIHVEERSRSFAEAHRVLRLGGRLVVQDFETGTPTARWYSEVLDRYTLTGHAFEHFTRESMTSLISNAGFSRVELYDVYDPCILEGDTRDEAKVRLLGYLVDLFALQKSLLVDGHGEDSFWSRVEKLVRRCSTFATEDFLHDAPSVRELTVRREGERYRAELPRMALVGVGTK